MSSVSSIDPDSAAWLPSEVGDVKVTKWSGKVGSADGVDAPLVELASTTETVVAELDDPTEDRLKPGAVGTITSIESGKTAKVTVERLDVAGRPLQDSTPRSEGDSSSPESDVPEDQSRRVVLMWAGKEMTDPSEVTWVVALSPASDVSVPLAAISSCGGTGSCVTVVKGGSRRPVPVETTVVGDTGVAVHPAQGATLSAGDTVELSAPQ